MTQAPGAPEYAALQSDMNLRDERLPPVGPSVTDPGQSPPAGPEGSSGPASLEPPDTTAELRAKAVRGGATLLARGVGVRLVGVVGTLVLARLISPHSLGLAALGATALVVGALLADGGVGVGLLRRAEPPSPAELSALLGFQLVVALLLSAAAGLVGLLTGTAGLVTAAMLAVLPVYALRAPATILCERRLDYGPVAAAEIAEAVAYTVVAVSLAFAGLGVWAVVLGSAARAVVGTAVLLTRSPHAPLHLSGDFRPVRPLLAFGLRFQSAGLVSLVRDEGLNVVVAVIGGVSQLGVWSLGRRFAQVSFVLFETLWRVSYPVLARLIDAGVDVRRELDRGLRLSGAGTGLALVGLAASGPSLIPAVVGPGWSAVPALVLAASAGLVVSGPVSVTFSGYLYALGEPALVVRVLAVSAVVWLGLGAVLLPVLGVAGVGLAWTLSSWCEVTLLTAYSRRTVPGLALSALVPSLVAAVAAVAPVWLVARQTHGLVAGLLEATLATAGFAVLLCLLDRSTVPTLRQLRRAGLASA